ncbi:N-6 DNA methylase [Salinispora sp. H7-4]|uniref:N-6 DNA methylase n=1 Tax=Salinispora sp. H7-4 TaxID=2748321 RepID=UPI0015D1C26B|nr:N-6 DNA methylase [Salinispora sp. H7-4]NYT94086.1 N-6 DNA methylase [Salinispora sp. H7-4]
MTLDHASGGAGGAGERRLMTRLEIAQAAGVHGAAVNNWMRRHPDFPDPVRTVPVDLFAAEDVAEWLDSRKIQRDERRDGETAGTTYGRRFRLTAGLADVCSDAKPAPDMVAEAIKADLWKSLEPGFTQSQDHTMFQEMIMALVCAQAIAPKQWTRIADTPSPDLFAHVWSTLPTADGVRPELLDRIVRDGWWQARFRTGVKVLQRWVQPGTGASQERVGRRLTAAAAFDHLLDRFAQARKSSDDEYLTPYGVARLMVQLADPGPEDRVYNPCCGSGEIVAAVLEHQRGNGAERSLGNNVSGHALASRAWRLAVMNTAVHGRPLDLGGPPPNDLKLIDVKRGPYDVVLANPPFTMPAWRSATEIAPTGWPYGEPSRHNAHFAWLQLIATALAPEGRAVAVMPSSTTSVATSKSRQIRAAMVEEGVVRCIIELPKQMFRETASPLTLWLLGSPTHRPDREVLLIDAKKATERAGRTHRILTDTGSGDIVDLYQKWSKTGGGQVKPTSGITAVSVSLERLREHGHDLTPSTYLRPPAPDVTSRAPNPTELRAELCRLDDVADAADLVLDRLLDRLQPWNP